MNLEDAQDTLAMTLKRLHTAGREVREVLMWLEEQEIPPEAPSLNPGMRVGVHLPNDGKLLMSDLSLIHDSGLNLVKGLVRLDLPAGYDTTPWREIAKALPSDATIILRLYAPMGGGAWEAKRFVTESVAALTPVMSALKGRSVLVEIHNEPNHPNEGFGPTLEGAMAWSDWYQRVYSRLNRETVMRWPGRISLGWPGLAQAQWNHKERDYVRANKRNLMERCAWVGCHCYWQSEGNDAWQLGELTLARNWQWYRDKLQEWGVKKSIYVTEAGNSNCDHPTWRNLDEAGQIREYTQWCHDANAGGVAGVAFFIYGGTPDWAGFRLYPGTVMALGKLAQEFAG